MLSVVKQTWNFLEWIFDCIKLLNFARKNINHSQNFNTLLSLTKSSYRIVLDTDAEQYGGHKLLDHNVRFHTFPEPWNERPNHIFVSEKYLCSSF